MIRHWLTTTSRTTIGWVAVIVVLVLIALPTAIWFGAASFLFDSPQEGLRSFGIVLALGVLFVVVEVVSDLVKERSKKSNGSPDARNRKRSQDR